MKLLNKFLISTSITVLLSTSIVADTYMVKSGDTLAKIVHHLGLNSLDEAEFKVPSGILDKIFPGDIIEYKSKKHKSKFKLREKINLKKFCFESNRSIHYRTQERCR
jgi:LysM repeat protein